MHGPVRRRPDGCGLGRGLLDRAANITAARESSESLLVYSHVITHIYTSHAPPQEPNRDWIAWLNRIGAVTDLCNSKWDFNRWKHTKTLKQSKRILRFHSRSERMHFIDMISKSSTFPNPTNDWMKCWIGMVILLSMGIKEAFARNLFEYYEIKQLFHTSHENSVTPWRDQWQ